MELLFVLDCINGNGKYYLYFCLDNGNEGGSIRKAGGHFQQCGTPVLRRDCPCGICGWKGILLLGQISACGVMLNEDMMSFDSEAVVEHIVTEERHHFNEESFMRKIGDTYYYIYVDVERGKPIVLGYATLKSSLSRLSTGGAS